MKLPHLPQFLINFFHPLVLFVSYFIYCFFIQIQFYQKIDFFAFRVRFRVWNLFFSSLKFKFEFVFEFWHSIFSNASFKFAFECHIRSRTWKRTCFFSSLYVWHQLFSWKYQILRKVKKVMNKNNFIILMFYFII